MNHVWSYCPRCDRDTRWVNVASRGSRLACAACKLEEAGLLTPEEAERYAAHPSKPP